MGNTPFRTPDPNEEATVATITTSYAGNGKMDTEVEWHLTEAVAMEAAAYSINDALDGVYAVTVYIVKTIAQCSVDSQGRITK